MTSALAPMPTPGYVYVFANPALPGWHKVGHTYRPPHRRANELSRTALPAAFRTAYARFFWDAVEAERATHAHLRQLLPGDACSKEFFRLDAPSLRRVIEEMPSPPARRAAVPLEPFDPDASWWARSLDPNWDRSSEGLEEQWSWAVERIGLKDPAEQRRGWRELERLSSSGWGEASWRLAELIVECAPSRSPRETAERAAWVAEAAELQGVEGGALRAAWLRSLSPSADLTVWFRALQQAWDQWGAKGRFPPHVLDTLHKDRAFWLKAPERRNESPWWGALEEAQGERMVRTPSLR